MRGRSRRPATSTTAAVLLAAAGVAGVLVGSTVDAGTGTALMVASSALPSVVLGSALVRARTDLAHETWTRQRLAGEVAVSDEQLRRLADRVDSLVDSSSDAAAELERTRAQLRRARVETATSRAVLAGVREQVVRDRALVDAAVAARDEARARANVALGQADAAAESARRAEAALARAGDSQALAELWRPPARVEGQRSFASVDMRVFDAFLEADMADEDAVLDAPTRRGRHAAEPALAPTSAAVGSSGATTVSTSAADRAPRARDVA